MSGRGPGGGPAKCSVASARKPSDPRALQIIPPRHQVQATVVGFLASIAAVVFGWIPDGHFSIPHAFLLCASSVATAFIASLVLGKAGKPGAGRGEACPGGVAWTGHFQSLRLPPLYLFLPCLAPPLSPQV